MYTRTESELYRLNTTEENRELEMHILNAPLLTADYVSSISQLLSPKRSYELRDLARIIRKIAEPQVRTKIPDDLQIRVYRDADTHPHLQAGLKVELCYAYALLHGTATGVEAERREEFLKEAVDLEKEVIDDLKEGKFYVRASIFYNLRMASLSYFRAAWNFMNDGNPGMTSQLVSISLEKYESVKRLIEYTSSDEIKEYTKILRQNNISQIGDIAQLNYDSKDDIFPKRIKADKESIDELLTMLVANEFDFLLQDVLFGEMRCYALQGDYKKLTKTTQELRDTAKKTLPATVITESATIVSYDADRNKLPDDLICTPFVSDSPPIVLENVKSIENSFGKDVSRLWMPANLK